MNLIAHDLVIVQPLSSMSGYITYIDYQFASNKGGITAGQSFANPFAFGEMTNERVDYTGARVVEPVTAAGTFDPAWKTPMEKIFKVITVDGTEVEFDPKASYTDVQLATVRFATYKVVTADKSIVYSDVAPTVAVGDKVAYVYNNVVIPQNDLPMVKAEVKSIALVAKARRIAVEMCAA